MANYYTHFSAELKIANVKQKEWVERQLSTAWVSDRGRVRLQEPDYDETNEEWEEAPLFLCEAVSGQELEFDELREAGIARGFDYELRNDEHGQRIAFYAEESGDPNTVAHFVQQFMQRFFPKDNAYWYMTFADVCDKNRPDGFGGGWVFVSATRREVGSAYNHIQSLKNAPWAKQKRDLVPAYD